MKTLRHKVWAFLAAFAVLIVNAITVVSRTRAQQFRLAALELLEPRRGDGSRKIANGVYLYDGEAAERRMSLMHRLGMPVMAGGASGHQSLFDGAKVKMTLAPASLAGAATVNGASVDMQGYDFVDFLVMMGVTDVTLDAILESSSDDAVADAFADVAGVAITQLIGTDDGKCCILSVAHRERGLERYVRLPLTAGAGTSAIVATAAVRYGESGGAQGRQPITQETTTKQVDRYN